MNLPLVLRAEAEAEFDEAFDFYNDKRTGLGVEFVAEVQRVFDRLSANPLIHREVFADVRKSVVRRFPYCVFYRPHPDRVEVLAVFHTSRDPQIWQSRA
ncbi:type II toxin-antitoxin system RelE/ParE family toxin [Gemmata sp.]|uniref:type II toxin-antitoxin system RelE/ParE family toxin n=1 Tax=Gemmata sp. TaxID=1914242 RepID=UPI003F6FF936